MSAGCSGYSAATGVGGNKWYRFVGAAGDAMPLNPPGVDHCGTSMAGWLSGWAGAGAPPPMYNVSGKYPTASEGVVERTACFNHGACCGPVHLPLCCCTAVAIPMPAEPTGLMFGQGRPTPTRGATATPK